MKVQRLYINYKSESISRSIVVTGVMLRLKMTQKDIPVGW